MKNGFIDISKLGVLEFLLGAAFLYIGLRLIRKAMNAYIRKRQIEPLANRFLPLIEFFLWMLFLVWGTGEVFQTGTAGSIALLTLTLAIVTWIGHVTLRDWIAGVIFKSEGKYLRGDSIVLGGKSGRLKRLGYRTLTLETPTGSLIEIPYSHLARQSHIEKIPGRNTPCTFQMIVPKADSVEEFLQQVRSVVLCAPWSSLTRQPHISLIGRQDGHLLVEVSAYVLDERYAHHVEAYVKKRFSVAGGIS